MNVSLEELRASLQSAGLKATKQRLALLQVMTEHHGPFSSEDLRHHLNKKKSPLSCDMVTIYRCLSKFEKAGLVDRCDFGDGVVRFEKRSQHHHHHIICRKCKKVEVLEICHLDTSHFGNVPHGYKDVSHKLEFFGICPACL